MAPYRFPEGVVMNHGRRRRSARWVGGLLSALTLAVLAVAGPRWGGAGEAAGDPGFLLGCPAPPAPPGAAAPSSAVTGAKLVGEGAVVDWVRADGSTGQKTFPLDEVLLSLLFKTPKPFDTDADGAPDMTLAVTGGLLIPSLEGVTGTLLQDVVDTFKSELSPWNLGWVAGFKWLRVEIGRVPGAPDTGVVDAATGLDLELTLADGSTTVKPVRIGLRKDGSAPADGFVFPDAFGLSLHMASPVDAADVTMLRAEVDYEGVAEADQPGTELYLMSGTALDLRLGWSGHTPKEFAFGDMQRCFPNLGDWGTQPENPYNYLVLARSGGPGTTAPGAHLDIVSGAGEGTDGAAELAVGADVKAMPVMFDAMLKKDVVRLHRRIDKDEDSGLPVGDVSPDLSFTYASATQGEEPGYLEMDAKALTEWAVLKMQDLEDGTLGDVDVRFCDGSGGEDLCAAATGGPAVVQFRYQNHLPDGGADPLAPLPGAEHYVAYDSLQPGADPAAERYRVAGRLVRPEQVTFTEEPSAPPAGAFKVTSRVADGAVNEEVAVHVDTDDTAAPDGEHLQVEGVVDTLPKTLEATYATDPAAGESLAVAYQAASHTGLAAKITRTKEIGPFALAQTHADVAFAEADGGAPTAFTFHMLQPAGDTLDRVQWTADGPATLTVNGISFQDVGLGAVPSLQGTHLRGRIADLPGQATIDAREGIDDSVGVDVRFCAGAVWGDPGCDAATAPAAAAVEVVAQNFPFGEAVDLPPLPAAQRWVGYAALGEGDAKRWRAGGALNGVQHLGLSSDPVAPVLPTSASLTIQTKAPQGAPNSDVALQYHLRDDAGVTTVGGTIDALPADVERIAVANVVSDTETTLLTYEADAGVGPHGSFAVETGGPDATETTGTLQAQVPASFSAVLTTVPGTGDKRFLWIGSDPVPEFALSLQATGAAGGSPLGVDIHVGEMPTKANVDVRYWPDGALQTLDAAFCEGTWLTPACDGAAPGAAGDARVVAHRHPGGPPPFAADLPDGDKAWVAYDARDADGDGPAPAAWRAGGELRQVRRLTLAGVAGDVAKLLGLDGVGVVDVDVTTVEGANPEVILRLDDDSVHPVADPADPAKTLGAGGRLHVEGPLAPLPAHMTVKASRFEKFSDPKPENNGTLLVLSGAASSDTTLDVTFLSELPNGVRDVDGEILFSPGGGGVGVPPEWDLTFGTGEFCAGVDFDTGGDSPELGSRRGCLDWEADDRTHLEGGLSYITGDPDRPERYRVFTNSVLPTDLTAQWRPDGTELRHMEAHTNCTLLNSLTRVPGDGGSRSGSDGGEAGGRGGPAHGGAFCDDVDVKLLRLPQADPVGIDYLADPPLAVPHDPADGVFPEFTAAPEGLTVGIVSDSDWGARVHVTDLTAVSYTRIDTGDRDVTDICVEALPTANAFAAGLFHHKLPGLERPLYVDGVLSTRPTRVGLRLDPQVKPNSADVAPLAWLSLLKCHPDPAADLPDPDAPAQVSDVKADLRVRAGDEDYLQQLVATRPADRTPERPDGIDVHVQTQTAATAPPPGLTPISRVGVDATAKVVVADHLVVYPVDLRRCVGSMPALDYMFCHKGFHYEPDDTTEASVKVLSTLKSLGHLRVEVRTHHADTGVTDTTAVDALDDLPGSFAGSFSLRSTARLHVDRLGLAFGGLANPAPDLGSLQAEYWDGATPAHKFGIDDEAHRWPNIRVRIDDVGPKLAARATSYAPEPPNRFPLPQAYATDDCSVKFRDPGVGPALEYVDATVDAKGKGDNLDLTARMLDGGRSALQLSSGGDNTVDATVDAKIVRIQRHLVVDEENGHGEACIDGDLPLSLQAQGVHRVRLSNDGVEWLLGREKGDGPTVMKVAERFGAETREGAWFAQQKVAYDPDDLPGWGDAHWWTNYTGALKPVNMVRKSTIQLGYSCWEYVWQECWSPFAGSRLWLYWVSPDSPAHNTPNVVSVDDPAAYMGFYDPDGDAGWFPFLEDEPYKGEDGFEGVQFVTDLFFDPWTLSSMRDRDESAEYGRPGEVLWKIVKGLGEPPDTAADFTLPAVEDTKPQKSAQTVQALACLPGVNSPNPLPAATVKATDGTTISLEQLAACDKSETYEWRKLSYRLRATLADGSTRYLQGHGEYTWDYPGGDSAPGAYLKGYGPTWLQRFEASKAQKDWPGAPEYVMSSMKLLDSGHLQLQLTKFRIVYFKIFWFQLPFPILSPPTRYVFDPSGNGGPVADKPTSWGKNGVSGAEQWLGTQPLKFAASVAKPVTLQVPNLLGCGSGMDCTLRWYFGDGTSADGLKVTHTYNLGGNYPALVMVYDKEGKVKGTRQVDVNVTGPLMVISPFPWWPPWPLP